MKNIAIINAIDVTPYALTKVVGGECAFERTLALAETLPLAESIIVLCSQKPQAKAKTVIRDKWSVKDLLTEIKRLAHGYDNIFYFFADCPLLDPGLASRMFDNHVKYFSDYTFADGYPYGLAVEIMKTQILDPLIALVKDTDIRNRETIFEIVKKDINAFDLETEIAPVDLRLLRVSLTADTKRNFLMLKETIAQGGLDAATVLDVLTAKPEILRTLPAYFSLQIVQGCPQVCSYCPYPVFQGDIMGKKAEMSLEAVEKIVKQISDFCQDAHISVSLWGEPALHSGIPDVISMILSREGLSLVIETSGIGWNREALAELAQKLPRAPFFIISLDSPDDSGYRTLRGPGFDEAVGFARFAVSLFKDHVYVQAVRMKENEEALEKFYRDWKKETEHVIIQKYDHFARFLPDRAVTDLSPLSRFPCWHVKRDMSILIDGTVPLCREDVNRTRVLGNIFKEPLETIWQRGEAVYREHIEGTHSPPCKECDEYYTYNF